MLVDDQGNMPGIGRQRREGLDYHQVEISMTSLRRFWIQPVFSAHWV